MALKQRNTSIVVIVVLVAVAAGVVASPDGAVGASFTTAERLQHPEDRYALAGGCYGVRGIGAGWIARAGDGFAASGADLAAAEPFHFQATALGRYLLYGTEGDYLAASDGLVGEVTDRARATVPGGMVSGLTLETSDAAIDTLADGPAGDATGRGASLVAAPRASELADWEIDQADPDTFTINLPATGQYLSASGAGSLGLVPAARGGVEFAFERTTGCAAFPEVEVNIEGDVLGADTPFAEVRGYLDAHLHMMAFEFLGGRARCGRPWHAYGVEHALVDCPDHEPGGQGAVLESVLGGNGTGAGHDTVGWPTFGYWPRYNSLTHEQIYYKWMERAWRGGLRMFVNLLVDNRQLCQIYPYKRNSCNEMDGVRLQHRRIFELQDYIDAQNGGPGEGWFRIVTDPFEARRVMNEGKLAVMLGIEVSVPLDCGVIADIPQCDFDQIDAELDEVYDMGVRQMELVNKFDNALSGVTGDAGTTGIVVNQGNRGETGLYWQMETCDHPEDPHWRDKTQLNPRDQGAPQQLTGRDTLPGGILQVTGRSGAAPLYGEGPHCNVRGLTPLGEHMIRRMIEKGMIFDPDHMSATARREALDLIAELGSTSVVSSHSWADDTIYQRVYELGGVVTPYAGGAQGFVDKWRAHKQWADPRYTFGFGYGADTNGFGAQGGPRGANVANPVTYPFTGFGGVTVHQQVSGERVYDLNADGVAHYGLYPDWLEDIRILAGDRGPELMEDMARGPEAYLQVWERALGIAPNACRDDVADITQAQVDALEAGDTPEDVLWALGQPDARTGTSFTYCAEGGTLTVAFSPEGALTGTAVI